MSLLASEQQCMFRNAISILTSKYGTCLILLHRTNIVIKNYLQYGRIKFKNLQFFHFWILKNMLVESKML